MLLYHCMAFASGFGGYMSELHPFIETFSPSYQSMGNSGGRSGFTRQSAYTSHKLKMKRRAKSKAKRKLRVK